MNTVSVLTGARPETSIGRTTLSTSETSSAPHNTMKAVAPQRPCAASTIAAGIHTSAVPPNGSKRGEGGDHAEHQRGGQADDEERNADQRALDQRRQTGAVDERARDRRQMVEQLVLLLPRHRNQLAQRLPHSARRRG